MTLATKTWSFASDAESWSASPASGVSMNWISTDGSPASGCLAASLLGKNLNPGTGYWEITGTWESLFSVPAGATVNTIAKLAAKSGPYNWRCAIYNVGSGDNYSGPLEVWDSAGTTLIATIANAESSVTGTTSWAAAGNTGSQSIGASYQASDTSIRLRMSVTLRTGNDKAAQVAIRQDEVALEVDYTVSAVTGSITEGVDAGDAISAAVTYPVSVTDKGLAGELISVALTTPVSVTDKALAGETISAQRIAGVSFTEKGLAGESFDATVAGSVTGEIAEKGLAGEVITASYTTGVTVTEKALAGDTMSASNTIRVTMGD